MKNTWVIFYIWGKNMWFIWTLNLLFFSFLFPWLVEIILLQGLNPGSGQWKQEVVTTEQPGNSALLFLDYSSLVSVPPSLISAVWTCPLELSEGHGSWSLFLTNKKWRTQKGFHAQELHRVLLGFTVTIEEDKQHDPESVGILMPFLPRSDCSSSYFISVPFSGL